MISIIIPTLNEETRIGETLEHTLSQEGDFEVIVADGGSEDATVERASRLVKVVCSPCGRGVQLNRGVQEARGDILVFLHADTRLPEGAVLLVEDAMDPREVLGGHFRNRYDQDHWLLRALTSSSGSGRIPFWYGDQTLFARKDVFESLGGFKPFPLMEDVDFGFRVRRKGRTVVIQEPVITSARRFERDGYVRTALWMFFLFCLFFLGVSPEQIARRYRHVR